MRIRVRGDGVALGGDFFDHGGVCGGHAANHEERRFGAMFAQGFEHSARITTGRAVVEGQNNFMIGQEVICGMSAAKLRPTLGVDFDNARKA